MKNMSPITSEKKTDVVDVIVSNYMEDVLTERMCTNVYQFCKKHVISEPEFYENFSSLEKVQKQIWVKFLENTIQTLENDVAYAGYTNTNKLVAFYFTFFEVLTLNRSYVVTVLPKELKEFKNLHQLSDLRIEFKSFIDKTLNTESPHFLSEQLATFTKPLIQESYWLEYMFILHFWLNDSSKGFENTDILIEKLVHTSQELKMTKPLESLVDLGKFIWKQKR